MVLFLTTIRVIRPSLSMYLNGLDVFLWSENVGFSQNDILRCVLMVRVVKSRFHGCMGGPCDNKNK